MIWFQKNLLGMKVPHYVYELWIPPLSSLWYSIFDHLSSLEILEKLPVSERLEFIRTVTGGLKNRVGESKWNWQQVQGQENIYFEA